MTAKYDLTINKGSNFEFWLQYLTEGNTGVNLSPYTSKFQLKKYKGEEIPIIFASKNGVTYGYTGGLTTGYSGLGGISLNTNYDSSLILGGIFVKLDANTTNSLTNFKYFYDLTLNIGSTYSQKILEGVVTVDPGVA